MKHRDLIEGVPGQEKSRRNVILLTVCIALMAVIASVSGLNVAQPKLAIAFYASQNAVLWMINSYTICLAALLLPFGALADRIGRRRVLLSGLIIFCLASATSGLASSTFVMILARIFSGIGAALIMPVTLAVITSTFPKDERSKAIGIWTGVAGGGGILGMYLSAVLVDFTDWRWLFILPVVLAIVSIILTIIVIPESRKKTASKFDIVGSLLSIIAVIGIVFTLQEFPVKGWGNSTILFSLITGISATVGFFFWELHQEDPILDMRLFRKRGLASGSVSLLVLFGVQAGIFVVLFPYCQGVLGWSGLRSTLGMMPMALFMMISSGLAPKLIKKIGSRHTMAAGVLMGCAGTLMMAAFVSVDNGYLSILPGMLAMGMGMGLTMTPSTEAITSSLSESLQGVASALNDVTRELGTALGVALLGSLVTSGYTKAIYNRLDMVPLKIAAEAGKGLANALAVVPQNTSQSAILIRIAREAFVFGWQQAMWTGAVVMAILFIYILKYGPPNLIAADDTEVSSQSNTLD